MKFVLTILNGSLRGERRVIQRRTAAVGSDLSCQLWVSDEGVSPRHAQFEARDGGVFVKSLDAAAPVRVAGLAVNESLLNDGDTVELGPVRVRFEQARFSFVRFSASLVAVALMVGAAGYGSWWMVNRFIIKPHAVTATGPGGTPVRVVTPPPAPESGGLRQMETLSSHLDDVRSTTNPPAAPTDAAPPSSPTGLPSASPAPPAQTPDAGADPTIPPGSDPVRTARMERAAREFETIRPLIAAGDSEAADARLAALQREEPEFLPAYAERARLLEKSGRLDKAEQQWVRLLDHAVGDPLYDVAAAQLVRLADLQMSAPAPVPVFHITPPEAPPEAPVFQMLKPKPAPPAPAPGPVAAVTAAPAPVVVSAPAPAVRPAPTAPAPVTNPPSAVAKQPANVRPPELPVAVAPPHKPPVAARTVPPAPTALPAPSTTTAAPEAPKPAYRPEFYKPVAVRRPAVAPAPTPVPPPPSAPAVIAAKPAPLPAKPVPAPIVTALRAPVPAKPVPAGPVIAKPLSVLRITGVSHRRMPASDDCDDMRLLQISVAPLAGAPSVRAESATVEVTFFDQAQKSGEHFPARAVTTANPLRFSGDWRSGAPLTVTATYVIPRGHREQETRTPAGPSTYYGYRVRLYYDGRLQAEEAKPADLSRP